MAQTAAQKAAAKRKADANLKASYGFVAALAAKVPEIRVLMQRAVREKWTSQRFQMAVAGTKWWKRTPAQTRQWITQQASDPASANRNLITGANKVALIAGTLGLSKGMTNAIARDIWLDGQLAGYDEQQMRGLIFDRLTGRVASGDIGGEFGSLINQAKEMAGAYDYRPADLDRQARDAAGFGLHYGDESQAGLSAWETKLKNYAKAKYGAFADRIDAGETVRDIAQPYIDVYGQILEVNPQDVGLDDKLLQKALQGVTEAGKPPAAQPVWQFEQELRKDPRWAKTNNANQAAASVLTKIGETFGMIGS